jgi:membrane-associated phospholipid phosphatase
MRNFIPLLATLLGTLLFVTSTTIAYAESSTAVADRGDGASERASSAIVVTWNQALLNIVRTPGAQPATVHPTRSFAILHAAIYDAVVAITRNAPPYLVAVNAPHGARADAAAAAAGHAVLIALYPAMRSSLDQQFLAELATIPNTDGEQQGIRVGEGVAAAVLAARANDGSAATPPPFVPGDQPGNYRSTPPNFPTPAFTNWANVTPFVLDNAAQFRPAAPPALVSQEYADAINEVKSLGQDVSTTRTAEQTQIGKFWAPPIWNTWNEIAEKAAVADPMTLERTARFFAVLNLTFADSVIAFYDAKYHYQLWRPITAIRLADTDGNPATLGDPTWTPLATTAPDPSYPGAHSTISAAGAAVLSEFFGHGARLEVTSDAMPGVVRSFESYNAVATEAGLSRIFAGQHTRLDHQAGARLGRDVAAFVLDRLSSTESENGDRDRHE